MEYPNFSIPESHSTPYQKSQEPIQRDQRAQSQIWEKTTFCEPCLLRSQRIGSVSRRTRKVIHSTIYRDKLPILINRVALISIILLVSGIVQTKSHAQDTDLSVSTSEPKQTTTPQVTSQQEVQIQERRKALFQRMLEDPADLDSSFEYANLSIQVGDMEAAISTLERMLVFAPGLPRLQLELGILYYQLSAYKTAESYFEAAISGDDVPQTVIDKVQQYLAAIEEATSTVKHSGLVRIGLEYQTNANQAPEGNTIILNGLPFFLDDESQASSDSNLSVSGNYSALQKLERQGVSMIYDVAGNVSKQLDRTELDFSSLEATVGPLFELESLGYENATLKVYGSAAQVYLDQHQYSTFLGGGAEIGFKPNVRSSGILRLEYFDKSFDNSPAAPRATDRNGNVVQFFANWEFIVDLRNTFSTTLEVTRNISHADYLSNLEFAAGVGHSYALEAPFLTTKHWILGNSLSVVQRNFDTADQFINENVTQKDTEYILRSSLLIPLDDQLSLLGEVGYRRVDSNYSTREHDNFNTMISILKSW